MAAHKPVEWVQAVVNRFEEQVNGSAASGTGEEGGGRRKGVLLWRRRMVVVVMMMETLGSVLASLLH